MLIERGDEQSLMGVAAHERDTNNSRFLPVFAMDINYQGNRWGTTLFKSVMEDAAIRSDIPAFATWMVRPENHKAFGFFEYMGADWTYPPEDKPLARFRFDLAYPTEY